MENLIQMITRISKAIGIEPELMISIVQHESNFDPKAVGDSGKAIGLGQIWLTTANQMGFQGTADELAIPENNIYWCCKYVRFLMNKFPDIRDVISGYNAGDSGVQHPYINQGYVQSVYMRYVALKNTKHLYNLMPLFFPVVILTAILTFIQSDK